MKKPPSPLRLAREARGLTLRQLREATGISTGRLSMLEREMVHPNANELERLGATLAVGTEQLFPNTAWPDVMAATSRPAFVPAFTS